MSAAERAPFVSCAVCGAQRDGYIALCNEHQATAEAALRAAYPLLVARFEERFGAGLDAWIADGRVGDLAWRWHDRRRAVDRMLDAVWEFVSGEWSAEGQSALRLTPADRAPSSIESGYRPYWTYWCAPDLEAAFKQHVRSFLDQALVAAVDTMPTGPLEADIIDTLVHPQDNGSSWDAARDILDSCRIDENVQELFDMRYWASSVDYYCEIDDHVLCKVWREHLDLLPAWLQTIAVAWWRDADNES